MKIAQYASDEFVTAAILNQGQNAVSGDIQQLGAAGLLPGLVNPDAAALSSAGLTVTASLPSPFAILFGTGILTEAHGTLTNADTQNYSVNFTGSVPGSGSVTAYLLASGVSIEQDAYQVVGPPPGHPDYNPAFIPYTAYNYAVDSLALYASTTPPDNSTSFELARMTLSAGATGVTLNTAYQQRTTGVNRWQAVAVSGSRSLAASDAGRVFQATAAATLTLPLASGSASLSYGLASTAGSGVVAFATTAPDLIYGAGSTPSSGIAQLSVQDSAVVYVSCQNGRWEVTAGNLMGLLNNTASGTASLITGIIADAPFTGGGTSGIVHIGVPAVSGGYLLCNTSSGVAIPAFNAVSAFFDSVFSNSNGALAFRNPSTSGWAGLNVGPSGQVLTSTGSGLAYAPTQIALPRFEILSNTSHVVDATDFGAMLYFTNVGVGVRSITLPSAVTMGAGWYFDIEIATAAGDYLTFFSSGGLIDGLPSGRAAGDGTRLRLMSNGADWQAVQGVWRYVSSVLLGSSSQWGVTRRVTWDHHMGTQPTTAMIRLINSNGQFGYSPGDVITATNFGPDNSGGIMFANHDASGNISGISIGNPPSIPNKTTGVNAGAITVADWNLQLVLEVWPY